MMMERILLQTIKFDLQVDHPYQYLIKFGNGLKGMLMSFEFCLMINVNWLRCWISNQLQCKHSLINALSFYKMFLLSLTTCTCLEHFFDVINIPNL